MDFLQISEKVLNLSSEPADADSFLWIQVRRALLPILSFLTFSVIFGVLIISFEALFSIFGVSFFGFGVLFNRVGVGSVGFWIWFKVFKVCFVNFGWIFEVCLNRVWKFSLCFETCSSVLKVWFSRSEKSKFCTVDSTIFEDCLKFLIVFSESFGWCSDIVEVWSEIYIVFFEILEIEGLMVDILSSVRKS